MLKNMLKNKLIFTNKSVKKTELENYDLFIEARNEINKLESKILSSGKHLMNLEEEFKLVEDYKIRKNIVKSTADATDIIRKSIKAKKKWESKKEEYFNALSSEVQLKITIDEENKNELDIRKYIFEKASPYHRLKNEKKEEQTPLSFLEDLIEEVYEIVQSLARKDNILVDNNVEDCFYSIMKLGESAYRWNFGGYIIDIKESKIRCVSIEDTKNILVFKKEETDELFKVTPRFATEKDKIIRDLKYLRFKLIGA